jgi:hypothetical protein
MVFDENAFAGAQWTLEHALEGAAKTTGIEREQLCLALYRHSKTLGNKRDAELWKYARNKQTLYKWIYKQAGGGFDSSNEQEMILLANRIPKLIRGNLIGIAKTLEVSRGGKPRAFELFDLWQVRHRVAKLRRQKQPLSKEKAYARVAKMMEVSAHTIRRACEPKGA